MHISTMLRLTAVILIGVLLLTLAAPQRADAEPATVIAIALGAAAVLILVVYLIVANTRGNRVAELQPVMVSCPEPETRVEACWARAEAGPAIVVPVPPVRTIELQS
jgi:hypothetical protein